MPMVDQMPEEFAAAVMDFLDEAETLAEPQRIAVLFVPLKCGTN